MVDPWLMAAVRSADPAGRRLRWHRRAGALLPSACPAPFSCIFSYHLISCGPRTRALSDEVEANRVTRVLRSSEANCSMSTDESSFIRTGSPSGRSRLIGCCSRLPPPTSTRGFHAMTGDPMVSARALASRRPGVDVAATRLIESHPTQSDGLTAEFIPATKRTRETSPEQELSCARGLDRGVMRLVGRIEGPSASPGGSGNRRVVPHRDRWRAEPVVLVGRQDVGPHACRRQSWTVHRPRTEQNSAGPL
jgi:hypothetical protein